jgi:hypothetical protein
MHLDRTEYMTIVRAMRRHPAYSSASAVAHVAAAGAAATWIALVAFVPTVTALPWLIVGMFLIVADAAVVLAPFFPALVWPLWRPPALARSRCPGCGYSLREIVPQADERRQCPECGAAWRL